MRSYTLEGIIIKRFNVGEADRIITVFSRDRGKVSLKAAGIRKISSKRAGSLELFNRVKISAVTGRGNWDVLTEVALLDTYNSWRRHLGRINLAYQLCETIDKLTAENQPYPEIYGFLQSALTNIGKVGNDWELKMKNWLLNILVNLGYWPADKNFTGDIYKFIEGISDRPLHSPRILKMLK